MKSPAFLIGLVCALCYSPFAVSGPLFEAHGQRTMAAKGRYDAFVNDSDMIGSVRPELRTQFRERYGYEVGVPVNWSAYEDIAEFFSVHMKEIDGERA